MRVQTTGITDVGCVRKNNEDSFFFSEELGLYAVADGIGGRERGEVASFQALRVLRASIRSVVLSGELHYMSMAALAGVLRAAVQGAADFITAQDNEMGTTLTALWLVHGKAIMAHVGDSRLYLRRGTFLRQLTEDHTLVGMMLRHGRLTQAEAADHPMRHVLLNSLGGKEAVQIDLRVFDVRPGDTFVLCSDGLSDHVSDREIASALPDPELGAAARWLVDLAKVRGGRDNITVLAVHVESTAAQSATMPRLEQRAS